MTHGEPVIFGLEQEKAISLNRESLQLEVIEVSGNEDKILVHDENNKILATMLATMSGSNFPVAVGVIYREDKTSFIDDSYQQLIKAREVKGSLQELLHSGHTWEVE